MKLYRSRGSHGIFTRQELLQQGMTRRELSIAEREGILLRIDRSRFALPQTDPDVLQAASLGGALTCGSALRIHGVATLPDPQLHLRRERYARRNRPLGDALDCHLPGVRAGGSVDTLENALRTLIRNHPAETAVVALDSVLGQRMLSRAELEFVVRFSGERGAHLLSMADARSESPLESVIRFRLAGHGIRVRPQVKIPTVGRVDLLIGDSLIIEADGYEFHGDEPSMPQFHEDRRRSRRASAMGMHVIRITWRQVMHEWDEVLADILTIVRSDRHRIRRGRAG